MKRFTILVFASCFLMLTQVQAEKIATGGHCSNWMTMELSLEVGIPDAKTTDSSCTALRNGGDFMTHYVADANTCLICALDDWTETPQAITTLQAGTYKDTASNGWDEVVLTSSGTGFSGHYKGTFVTGAKSEITIWPDGRGGYKGKWSEPGIGRSGTLENFIIHADGSFTVDWATVEAGSKSSSSGTSTFKPQ